MSNQPMLLPSAIDGASAPPINLDTLNTGELRDLCKGMFSDLSFLAGAVPSRVTSLLSTGLTAGSAVAAGAIDGYLGEKANIGPVALTTAIAIGSAALAVVAKSPDRREAAAAVARGFGAPVLYEASKSRVKAWRDTPKLAAATPAKDQRTL